MSLFTAPQDDCWDQVCPTATHGNIAKQKLDCLHANKKNICNCCKLRGLPDCKILIPNVGLQDVCREMHTNSSSYRQLGMYNGEKYMGKDYLDFSGKNHENFVSLSGAVRRPYSPSYYDPNYKQPLFPGVN